MHSYIWHDIHFIFSFSNHHPMFTVDSSWEWHYCSSVPTQFLPLTVSLIVKVSNSKRYLFWPFPFWKFFCQKWTKTKIIITCQLLRDIYKKQRGSLDSIAAFGSGDPGSNPCWGRYFFCSSKFPFLTKNFQKWRPK